MTTPELTRQLLLVALLAAHSVAAADLPRGELIEKVACVDDPEISYALYLPSAYSESSAWPVIYAFTPSARGALPVRLLMDAAERYGYIVVGSNDIRNGPWEPTVKAQKALWREVNARFAVDPKRSYATGFSGGARASVSFALEHRPSMAGVILCGAAFSLRTDYPRNGGFAVYGLVGDSDLNMEEHIRAESVLAKKGYTQWHEIFEGAHQWPSSAHYLQAVQFLEIDAMRRHLKEMDETFIQSVAQDLLDGAIELRDAGKPVLALRRLRNIANTFGADPEGKQAQRLASELESSPEVVELVQAEEEFVKDLSALNGWRDYESFRATAERMKDRAASGGPYAARADRVLFLASIFLSTDAVGILQRGTPHDALLPLHVAATLYPDNAIASYNAACAFARAGDKKAAIEFLKSAAIHSFNNVELLDTDSDLRSLRDHPDYEKIRRKVVSNREGGLEPKRYSFEPLELAAPTPRPVTTQTTTPDPGQHR